MRPQSKAGKHESDELYDPLCDIRVIQGRRFPDFRSLPREQALTSLCCGFAGRNREEQGREGGHYETLAIHYEILAIRCGVAGSDTYMLV